jgi:hypothetical protein
MSADASVEMVLWILVGENSSNPSPAGANRRGKNRLVGGYPSPLPTEKSCWGRGSQKGVCKIQSANDLEVKIQKSKKLGPWVAGFVYTAFALTMMS